MLRFRRDGVPFLFVALLVVVTVSGCDTYSHSRTMMLRDAFCDGKSVAIIKIIRESRRGQEFMAHGGYLISEHEEMWAINWSVQENNPVAPPHVTHLGEYTHRAADRGKKRLEKSGILSPLLVSTGTPGVTVLQQHPLRVLENGEERYPENIADTGPGLYPIAYVFTRNRKYLFRWEPTPAIYSIPDMKEVRRFDNAPSYNAFTELYDWTQRERVILTEDLSHLIAVTYRGVYCYDTTQDEVTTIPLERFGDARIIDAEFVQGELRWLVSDGDYRAEDWAILDNKGDIVTEFTLPAVAMPWAQEVFWGPSRDVVWIVRYTEYRPSRGLDFVPEEMSLLEYKIADETLTEIPLPGGMKLDRP